jgi:hypothetical protein
MGVDFYPAGRGIGHQIMCEEGYAFPSGMMVAPDNHAQYEIRVYSDAMVESVKAVAPFAWEAYQDYVISGLRFSRIEQSLLEQNLPARVIEDILEDLAYQITATLHKNKPRDENELYSLYQKQDGSDSNDDFKLKWDSGEIETGNARELREFKEKLISLKKITVKSTRNRVYAFAGNGLI